MAANESYNFLNALSTHFLICKEKIDTKGEDSGFESYNHEAGIAAAFDGCGGLGARRCLAAGDKTEAYLASRSASDAARQWFDNNCTTELKWDTDELKELIDSNLDILKNKAGSEGPKLMGSMVRSFPTTMAAIVFYVDDGELISKHIWAGDSRTYILEESGLAQISKDDIMGEDAMTNLMRDGALTNVISADKKYTLGSTTFIPEEPCLMFSSSDGCFGYVPSPMHFEYMILKHLVDSESVDEWKDSLAEDINERAGDDQTLALAAFGFESFQIMRQYYVPRLEELSGLIQKFDELDDEDDKLSLWETYKPNYYRYQGK